MRASKGLISLLAMLLLAGCSTETPSFAILPDADTFLQTNSEFDGKIDILWVIDNSGSMDSSQRNVATNFQSFIQRFQEKQLDFRMAVTTTDSYRAIFANDPTLSRFRDGTDFTAHSGVFVIDPLTPNINQVFMMNLLQGTQGDGDERAFQSFKEALDNPLNASFRRAEAFLAVIIVSDEDDFSHDGSDFRGGQYSYTGLHTIQSYVDYLSQLTGSTSTQIKFNVSAINIFDQNCLDSLNASISGRKIGHRYGALVDATGGVKGSLCASFADTLTTISDRIIELTTQFYLSREPKPETLRVIVNGLLLAESSDNGWTYNSERNSIMFHGDSIPQAGSTIQVTFDPVAVK